MSRRVLSAARAQLAAILVAITCPALLSTAAEPAAAAAKDDSRAAETWLAKADEYCAAIQEPAERSEAYSKLAYEDGHAGNLTRAATTAAKVTNPQKAIYALTFVARQYHKQGDEDNAAKLLKAAREVAERNERNLTNFGHTHLVPALVELGMADEARDYAKSIADPVQRRLASREFIAALATYDLLDPQVVEMSEADWSEAARAHAHEGRVEKVHAAVKHVNDQEDRDRAYAALVEKLAEQKRWAEGEPIIVLIRSAPMQDRAREKLLHAWAHEQSADAIQTRLKQARSRAEKVPLNDELVAKLVAEDRVAEAEKIVEEAIAAIENTPKPKFVSKFGEFGDEFEIAMQKSNYLVTAKALARQGKKAAAQERIDWAEEPIRRLPPEAGMGKMMLVLALVGTKIDLGELESAQRAIDSVEPPNRSMPAARLAKAYAKAGNAAGAIKTVRLIGADGTARGNLYGDVAGELIRSGHVDAARQLLKELGPGTQEAQAYREVGEAMAESGKTDELITWLAEMPDAVHKAFACVAAAEALRKAADQQPANNNQ